MSNIVKIIAIVSLMIPSLFASEIAKCQGCHGSNFEKSALGKSKIVKDFSKKEIISALKGYKDGSYGGQMAEVMKSQVLLLNDDAIKAIANEIKK